MAKKRKSEPTDVGSAMCPLTGKPVEIIELGPGLGCIGRVFIPGTGGYTTRIFLSKSQLLQLLQRRSTPLIKQVPCCPLTGTPFQIEMNKTYDFVARSSAGYSTTPFQTRELLVQFITMVDGRVTQPAPRVSVRNLDIKPSDPTADYKTVEKHANDIAEEFLEDELPRQVANKRQGFVPEPVQKGDDGRNFTTSLPGLGLDPELGARNLTGVGVLR